MELTAEQLTEGVILHFDKPKHWSSFKLVKQVKRYTKAKKVGHAGTLDPLATGVVIICLGRATKLISTLQELPKVYTGTITLGATTPCFDMEQEIDKTYPTAHITNKMIIDTAKTFEGEILQTPPAFSAVKVNGSRAYKLARQGETPKINPKLVQIDQFEITRIALPEVDFRITCGKGTYIRSLARDLGIALNSGGYLTNLVRESIGKYSLENCIPLEKLENIVIH